MHLVVGLERSSSMEAEVQGVELPDIGAMHEPRRALLDSHRMDDERGHSVELIVKVVLIRNKGCHVLPRLTGPSIAKCTN
ncbi:hypothetical protein SDC9_203864 [bioreactor metagenome]|uniref:Uncharacterized protein n=1 Tax=bioreactor metagenome TaxID=1076179 RepID=A0A645IXN9_9ZZZZ